MEAMKTGGRGIAGAGARLSVRRALVVVAGGSVARAAGRVAPLRPEPASTSCRSTRASGATTSWRSTLDYTRARVPRERRTSFPARASRPRHRRSPGVTAAAGVRIVPLGGNFWNENISVDGTRVRRQVGQLQSRHPGLLPDDGYRPPRGPRFRGSGWPGLRARRDRHGDVRPQVPSRTPPDRPQFSDRQRPGRRPAPPDRRPRPRHEVRRAPGGLHPHRLPPHGPGRGASPLDRDRRPLGSAAFDAPAVADFGDRRCQPGGQRQIPAVPRDPARRPPDRAPHGEPVGVLRPPRRSARDGRPLRRRLLHGRPAPQRDRGPHGPGRHAARTSSCSCCGKPGRFSPSASRSASSSRSAPRASPARCSSGCSRPIPRPSPSPPRVSRPSPPRRASCRPTEPRRSIR